MSEQETNVQPLTRNRTCLPQAGGGWKCRLHHSGRLFPLVFHDEKAEEEESEWVSGILLG